MLSEPQVLNYYKNKNTKNVFKCWENETQYLKRDFDIFEQINREEYLKGGV